MALNSQQPSLASKDIFRYRKIRGVNIGAWFVLEPWISDEPFKGAVRPKVSDLDLAKGSEAKENLERHWDTWIREEDWKWIADKGINTVRIPIGYYHLSGPLPNVLNGTDFEPYKDIYAGAWTRIKKAINDAGKQGLGVLIDLHAAPGGQNTDSHSGTSTGQARFWESKDNLQATVLALRFLARELASIPHCIGLELINEPSNNNQLQQWYESTISLLRNEPGCADFPIYISDAWDLNWYSKIVGDRPDFVVVDHHLYRCFTDQEQNLSGDDHAGLIRSETRKLLEEASSKAKGNIIIGEWSAGLNPKSLRSTESGEQDRQRRVFARAQLECYEATTAGWFWWTFKKQGWDAGWSMKDAITADILPNWFGRRRAGLSVAWNEGRLSQEMRTAFNNHTSYWRARNQEPEAGRFEAGYKMGWTDAWMFAAFSYGTSVSELGFRSEWVQRRQQEHAKQYGHSQRLWEFEHGFNQGFDTGTTSFLS